MLEVKLVRYVNYTLKCIDNGRMKNVYKRKGNTGYINRGGNLVKIKIAFTDSEYLKYSLQ